MKIWTTIKNNGFGEAAYAARMGMKMLKNGCFGGYLNPDQVEELRSSGYNFRLHFDSVVVA